MGLSRPYQVKLVNLQVFFVFEQSSVQDIKSFAVYYQDPGEYFLNVYKYFLTNNDQGGMSLMTFLWYTPELCNAPQLHEVNRFDPKTDSWETKKFAMEKFKNFHNCTLHFNFRDQMLNESNEFIFDNLNSEYAEKIIRTIAFKANFTVMRYSEASNVQEWEDVPVACNSLGQKYFETTIFLVTLPTFLAVPMSEEYDCYEKLLLPFENTVWCFIFLFFVSAIFTIFCLRFVPSWARNFVIGLGVSTPIENLARILFGISQTMVSGRNFSRFLTMLFIMFCLIIRTAWQGKVYEAMQTEMRKPRVRSFQEAMDNNFTIIRTPNVMEVDGLIDAFLGMLNK